MVIKKFRVWLYFEWQLYKHKIKPYLKPTLLVSFLLAWFITNGWSYLLIIIGKGWLRAVAITYAGILWLPFTPEKLITIPLALWLQKIIFIRRH